jgi:hypothetical protein
MHVILGQRAGRKNAPKARPQGGTSGEAAGGDTGAEPAEDAPVVEG